MWQGIGIACLMSTQCKPQKVMLAFIVGVILGITLGCTLTLSYSLQINTAEYNRIPRMDMAFITNLQQKQQANFEVNTIYNSEVSQLPLSLANSTKYD